MKIFYQGTAAAEGVPAVFCDCKHCRMARTAGDKEVRMRSGALIDGVLKIDFGPDAYAQSLRFGHSYVPVENVLITHSHRDHLCESDLACIHPPYSHREKPLTVYGDARVGERLKPFCDDKELVFVQLNPFETVTVGDYAVTPLEAVHAVGSGEEPLFYLIERDGKSILYAHDTDIFTDADMTFLKNRHLDLISLDCTNGVLDLDYIGHMGITENLLMRQRLIENGTADENTVFVANHFSHNGLVAYEEMQKRLPGFLVSYDGLTVEV